MKINFSSLIERLALSREPSECAYAGLERPKKSTVAVAAPTMPLEDELMWAPRPPTPEGIETPFQFFHLILS